MKKRASVAPLGDSVACYVELVDRGPEPHKSKLQGALLPSTRPPPSSSSSSLWTPENVAIPITYIYTGLLSSLPTAYIEYFPRQLGASDAQLSTISVLRSLPWTFKVLFGVFPDRFPIQQLRFKPYLLLGCLISSCFHLWLSAASNSLSIVSFTLLLLGSMVGIVMADVMSDALVANRVLRKQELYPGHVQSVVYLCRFVSEMCGYWGGALISNRSHWGFGVSMSQLFALIAVFPLLTVLPCIWIMHEPSITNVPPVKVQLEQLWLMLQRRATWQPVCFLVFCNAFLVHNAAWGNYLKVAFHFDAFQYGAMSAIGASVTFFAILIYKHCILGHFDNPWHYVYLITGVVISLFSVLNVLLVWHVNDTWGVPAFWFAAGDVAVISFAKGFQYLPLALMFVSVCPEQQEGVAFALLTSITNVSHAFAHTISNLLLALWPAELSDLEQDHFDGVWKLTMLTAAISLVPLLFVRRLLPRGALELERMKDELSPRWAAFVVGIYTFGVVWVAVLSLIAIVQPCHVLVGGHGC
uniref:Uncharacterized protein n=1 Tax=Globisporangium ultimum (strain ATCC 200006 / CBS 805.95 / DAOM BR144) TaxID=431595 RepID=K3X8X3_GLOUD